MLEVDLWPPYAYTHTPLYTNEHTHTKTVFMLGEKRTLNLKGNRHLKQQNTRTTKVNKEAT